MRKKEGEGERGRGWICEGGGGESCGGGGGEER